MRRIGFPRVLFGLAACVVTALYIRQGSFFTPTDSSVWLDDSQVIRECLASSAVTCPGISKFSSAYQINSFLVALTPGADTNYPLFSLTTNLTATLLTIFLIAPLCKKIVRPIALYDISVTILLTPLPWFYIYSGALEYQSGLALVLYFFSSAYLFACSSQGKPRGRYASTIIVASSFAFCLYKDTYALILGLSLVLSHLVFLPRTHTKATRAILDNAYLSLTGISGSAITSTLLNIYRYGDILPRDYIHEAIHRSPDVYQSALNLSGILLSPSGGFMSFWGVACIYVLALCFKRTIYFTPSLLCAIFFFIFTVLGLSSWWSPFGWFSWGNRLVIPASMAIITSISISTLYYKRSDFLHDGTLVIYELLLKNKYFKVVSAFCIVIFFASSLYFLIVPATYPTRAKAFYEYHNLSRACQDLLRQERVSRLGDSFWRGKLYYDCLNERYWLPIGHSKKFGLF